MLLRKPALSRSFMAIVVCVLLCGSVLMGSYPLAATSGTTSQPSMVSQSSPHSPAAGGTNDTLGYYLLGGLCLALVMSYMVSRLTNVGHNPRVRAMALLLLGLCFAFLTVTARNRNSILAILPALGAVYFLVVGCRAVRSSKTK